MDAARDAAAAAEAATTAADVVVPVADVDVGEFRGCEETEAFDPEDDDEEDPPPPFSGNKDVVVLSRITMVFTLN